MGISREILAVERPRNTVVHDSHGNGRHRYSVVARVGCVRTATGNHPVNGRVVGHIIDGAFVPCVPKAGRPRLVLRRYGDFAMADRFGRDILDDLLACHAPEDAMRTYLLALLRICEPEASCSRLADVYGGSWLSVQHPQVDLSPGAVSASLAALGKDRSGMVRFMRRRLEKAPGDHGIVVAATLKSDRLPIELLYPLRPLRNACLEEMRPFGIVYAYDADLEEPLAMQVLPDGAPDADAYRRFLAEMGISRCVLLAGEGFPATGIRRILNQGMHYVLPVPRSRKLPRTHGMFDFDENFVHGDDHLLGRRRRIPGGRFLYSFLDPRQAYLEQAEVVERLPPGRFDAESLDARKGLFGVVVLVSDLDLALEDMYSLYVSRRGLDDALGARRPFLTTPPAYDPRDPSVLGTEFVDFVASAIAARLARALDRAGLLRKRSFDGLLEDFGSIFKYKLDHDREWSLYQEREYKVQMLVDLGLLEGTRTPPKKKRGRPRKTQGDAAKPDVAPASQAPGEAARSHA